MIEKIVNVNLQTIDSFIGIFKQFITLEIFIESENNLIDNVFLTWKDGIDIKNGMSLIDIKKNFLKL